MYTATWREGIKQLIEKKEFKVLKEELLILICKDLDSKNIVYSISSSEVDWTVRIHEIDMINLPLEETTDNKTDWSKLSDSVSTILERSDLNRRDWNIIINQELEIPYFKGTFTEDMAKEIVDYQYSKENEGYYSAKILDGVLMFKFLKRAF